MKIGNHKISAFAVSTVVALCTIGAVGAQQPYNQSQFNQQQFNQPQYGQQQLPPPSAWSQDYQSNLAQRNARLQQQQMGTTPQAMQYQRWRDEWMQKNPGQPVPNMGVLEHLHEGEIINNTRQGFDLMRQKRQEELQRNFLLAKQLQMKNLAAQNITWGPEQWKNWARQYDQQQRQNADDYLKNAAAVGQMERDELRRRNLGF